MNVLFGMNYLTSLINIYNFLKCQVEFERINGQVAVAEKKLNTFDKVVGEWRLKCEDLSAELDNSQRECRNQSSELFRIRAAWDEAVEQLDSVRR